MIGKKLVSPVDNRLLSMSAVRLKMIDSSKKTQADRMRFMAAASVVRFSLKRSKYEGGMMNRKTAPAPLLTLVFFIVLFVGSFPVSAFDVVTIVGEVNDANQIISEGDIYEVDDTPPGDDLVKNYIGQKVKVTGKMRIEGDMRILEITALEVVEK